MRTTILILFCLLLEVPGSALDNLRGLAFGEVLVSSVSFTTVTVRVYNTTRYGTYPEALWKALDADALTRTLGVKAVRLNGPRYWASDVLAGPGLDAPSDVKTFGSVKAAQVATLTFDGLKGRPSTDPFMPSLVTRDLTVVFHKGRPVTRLRAPDGQTWVLTSTARPLPFDAATVVLPTGWTLVTANVAQDLVLLPRSPVRVLQDSQLNTYQALEEGTSP
jgi:hypothetical protein